MLRDRVQQGVWTGVVAAAATAGALIGLGHAHRAWLRPVNAIAYGSFGTRALLLDGFDPAITVVALVIHLTAIVVWSIVFMLIAGRLRGGRLVAAAVGFTAIVYAIDQRLLPPAFAPGFERMFSTAETLVVYATFALALAAGARLGAEVIREA